MKKVCFVLLMAVLLSGCAAQETFETVADEILQPVMAQPAEISVRLPDNAVAPVLESDQRQVYMSEEYEILIETVASGDLSATIRDLCGYEKDQLTVMETQNQNVSRYEFVWACAGEKGDRLGRAVILDDGDYHYCLSVLRDAVQEKCQIVWSDVFASFTLV